MKNYKFLRGGGRKPLAARVLGDIITSFAKQSVVISRKFHEIATVISFPRNCTCHYELCRAKRSNLIKKCAFTLAEVLITLGIIGVVAAITLPILIQNHQKTVWVNQLKKTVSTLENGFRLVMADEGVDTFLDTSLWQNLPTGCTGNVSSSNCDSFFANFRKYFNVTYDKHATYRTFTNLNNSNIEYADILDITLSSGVQIHLDHLTKNVLTGNFGPLANIGNIVVDVNGIKSPNKMGRDVFLFGITPYGQVIPYGSPAATKLYCEWHKRTADDLSRCLQSLMGNYNWDTEGLSTGCSKAGNGWYCAARIMAEG